jgi:hypothetical protein
MQERPRRWRRPSPATGRDRPSRSRRP